MIKISSVAPMLKSFYSDEGPERVGFLIDENTVVEVPNTSDKPEQGFQIDPLLIIQYTEEVVAVALFHTHPNKNANLSGEDYDNIKRWPELIHIIIGNDMVRAYQYSLETQAVMEIIDD